MSDSTRDERRNADAAPRSDVRRGRGGRRDGEGRREEEEDRRAGAVAPGSARRDDGNEDDEPRHEGGGEGRQDGGDGARRGAAGRKARHVVNWLEGVVSGVSLLLLLGAVGYLAWEGVQPDRPPSFSPVVQEVRSTPAGYDVLFDVRNGGDESVQNLAIEVELRSGDAVVARAETSLAWLPAGSTRTAAVILAEDPREHELDFTFVGYELP